MIAEAEACGSAEWRSQGTPMLRTSHVRSEPRPPGRGLLRPRHRSREERVVTGVRVAVVVDIWDAAVAEATDSCQAGADDSLAAEPATIIRPATLPPRGLEPLSPA